MTVLFTATGLLAVCLATVATAENPSTTSLSPSSAALAWSSTSPWARESRELASGLVDAYTQRTGRDIVDDAQSFLDGVFTSREETQVETAANIAAWNALHKGAGEFPYIDVEHYDHQPVTRRVDSLLSDAFDTVVFLLRHGVGRKKNGYCAMQLFWNIRSVIAKLLHDEGKPLTNPGSMELQVPAFYFQMLSAIEEGIIRKAVRTGTLVEVPNDLTEMQIQRLRKKKRNAVTASLEVGVQSMFALTPEYRVDYS